MSKSPDSPVERPRDEAHFPLGRHIRHEALRLVGVTTNNASVRSEDPAS
jgi:hypothetical protein